MAKTYINGYLVTGSTNYASAINCVDKDGNKSTVQAEIDELNETVDILNNTVVEQNKNFSTAANVIGSALVAKGCSVPEGTSLLEMGSLIEALPVLQTNQNVYIYKDEDITIRNDITGGWTGRIYSQKNAAGNLAFETNNYINFDKIKNLTYLVTGNYSEGNFKLALVNPSGTETSIASGASFSKNATTTTKGGTLNVSSYTGMYKIRAYVGNNATLGGGLISTIYFNYIYIYSE